MENLEMIKPKRVQNIINKFCYTIGMIPTSYKVSLTYEEQIIAIGHYLEETVIPALNNNAEAVAELQSLFVQLKDYVENYFDNLDVQNEINNKLDKMAQDGTLEHIIASYLQTQKIYNTTDEMIADASNLVNGLSVQTLGYHVLNDEGGAFFKITNTPSATEFQINLGNNLYATLIINENTLNVKQFGAYGDNTHDDTQAFKNAISFINNKYMNLYINKGEYILSEPLYIDWQNSNFWHTFDGSYSIKGAGIYETILKFSSSNGLHINRNQNILSIEISNFSIENTSYNPLEEPVITTTPDDSKGIGLLLKHIGYTGFVSRIGVRGFYIGIASRNCYGGPILDNLFTIDTVFGYSSKNDTTVQHNSCNYAGYESCYIQQGATTDLTNVICEGNLDAFKTNEYSQRGKFNGRGFSFYGGACNLIGCYSERLLGNARYIEDARIIENNGVLNNNMGYYLNQPEYSDLKSWVIANSWNYDEVYVNIATQHLTYCEFKSPIMEYGTAYINDANPNTYTTTDNDGKYLAPNVIFNGIQNKQGSANTFSLLSHGNAKPIVYLRGTYELYQENYRKAPLNIYGIVRTKNLNAPTNWNGTPSVELSRIASFTNTTYDQTMLRIRHTLDGAIRFYLVTSLNGTDVTETNVINIGNDGKVTFPQNN